MKDTTLKLINRYTRYTLYTLLIIRFLFLVELVFAKTTFTNYMSVDGLSGYVLDFTNIFLGLIVTFRYLTRKILVKEVPFKKLFFKNILFLIANVLFIALLFLNGEVEEILLTQLQAANNSLLPWYILLYILALYFMYSDYTEIYHRHVLAQKNNTTYKEINIQLTRSTEGSVVHFFVISLLVTLLGGKSLGLYLTNFAARSLELIAITTLLFTISLYILHKIKNPKQQS